MDLVNSLLEELETTKNNVVSHRSTTISNEDTEGEDNTLQIISRIEQSIDELIDAHNSTI